MIEDRIRSKITNTFLYVISCEEYVKIGVASIPNIRLREMQVGNPFPLMIERTWSLSGRDALTIEKEMKSKLRGIHQRGEWYKCDHHTASEKIEEYMRKNSIEIDVCVDGRKYTLPKHIQQSIDRLSSLSDNYKILCQFLCH